MAGNRAKCHLHLFTMRSRFHLLIAHAARDVGARLGHSSGRFTTSIDRARIGQELHHEQIEFRYRTQF